MTGSGVSHIVPADTGFSLRHGHLRTVNQVVNITGVAFSRVPNMMGNNLLFGR